MSHRTMAPGRINYNTATNTKQPLQKNKIRGTDAHICLFFLYCFCFVFPWIFIISFLVVVGRRLSTLILSHFGVA